MPQPTRYILTPIGSSGDVHPFVGIGRGLSARGHDVTVVCGEPFREPVEAAGLDFVASCSSEQYEALTHDPDLWHPRRGFELVMQTVALGMRALYETLERLHTPGQTLLVSHMLAVGARVFGEKHGVPAATLQLAPSAFRSEFRVAALAPGIDISAWPLPLKRVFWYLVDRFVLDPPITPVLNAWRAELGLAPVARIFRAWINSPRKVIALFPAWFAPPQPDWPAQLQLTGFPLYDEADDHADDAALEAWLAAGSKPILFAPGSANRHARRFFEVASEATARLGRRALLVTRYTEQLPTPLPSHVRHAAYLPFSRILPRSAALVHHGGIGTSAQGLKAGIPQLVMPMGFDQPDNAHHLERLGVGSYLSVRRFTARRLAERLGRLFESEATAAACARCADAIASAEPVARACDVLERLASESAEPRQA